MSESTDIGLQVGPANAVDDDLFAELAAVAREEGCELLHVGRSGPALQLILDHEDGVTLDHCSRVSRQSGALLDGLDYGSGRYVLEVSSPGLDREFYRLDDYRTYLGKQVKVIHRTDGRKQTVRGVLSSFDPANTTIEVKEKDSERTQLIHLRDVQTTRLELEV